MIDVAVTNALTALQTAIDNAGTLQNASQQVLAPVYNAVVAALAAIDAQSAAIEPTIDQTAVGGLQVGMPSPQLIATLVAQTQGATDMSNLRTLRGYVARIGVNVAPPPIKPGAPFVAPAASGPSLDFSQSGNSQYLPGLV